MILLYLCLIQSQIDYCCEIWGAHAINQTEHIIKLQKRAARMILCCDFHTPSKEMFSQLKWLPFNDRVTYFKCVFMYKCIHHLSSNFYHDSFVFVSDTHSFNTRHAANLNLIIPRARTEQYKHSIFYSSIFLWNNLPIEIKTSNSLNIFKQKIISLSKLSIFLIYTGFVIIFFWKDELLPMTSHLIIFTKIISMSQFQ